jgi:hypothetical protein
MGSLTKAPVTRGSTPSCFDPLRAPFGVNPVAGWARGPERAGALCEPLASALLLNTDVKYHLVLPR